MNSLATYPRETLEAFERSIFPQLRFLGELADPIFAFIGRHCLESGGLYAGGRITIQEDVVMVLLAPRY